MLEKDLDKVLNYMKQYVENKYEHDSEPMLTWKDLKLVLNEIERLNNIINEAINYIDDNTYYKGHKGYINIDDLYIILQKGSESNECKRNV